MQVSLIDYTGKFPDKPSDMHGETFWTEAEYAAALLIFTKSTRLEMKPGMLDEILAWPWDKKKEELKYMANTIPSSWEFCHYTFMIEGVTRAFTHQLVRTRTASFAQQTMRVLNVDGWTYGTGPTINDDDHRRAIYDSVMSDIDYTYKGMIEDGAAIEDARGILPTNIHTNIVMGANLRTMVEMIRKRSSPRTQGEYRDVLDALKAEMVRVHPWVEMFLDRSFDKAAKELDQKVAGLDQNFTEQDRTDIMKLVDQLRQGS